MLKNVFFFPETKELRALRAKRFKLPEKAHYPLDFQ